MLLLLSPVSCVRLCATPRRQPTKLLRPWDSPGKNTGVGCHFQLQKNYNPIVLINVSSLRKMLVLEEAVQRRYENAVLTSQLSHKSKPVTK